MADTIRDDGYSAGSLKRPGLTRVRELVASGTIDGVLCTWYDRFTRSREFYIVDGEFRKHNVSFVTIHDPADRNTAAGRFLEMMLVGAKAYEREQTGEKVSIKLRMRAEKGMWNGGTVPFGFIKDSQHYLQPDPEKIPVVGEIFRVYVKHASHFAVRDWLKANLIAAPSGKPAWTVGTIRDLLCNRRYIAEIEINKKNAGISGLPEALAYRIVAAPHEPLVNRELFETAQAIRQEKAFASPNRRGRPRSESRNQCDRTFPLQSRIFCAECRHSMTPYYVVHKPNEKEKRRSTSYVYYYACSNQVMNGRKQCGHSNRVLARRSEEWVLEQLKFLADTPGLIEEAVQLSKAKASGDLKPERDALAVNERAIKENRSQIERLIQTVTSGTVSGSLLSLLNQKAEELQREQGELLAMNRSLQQALSPLEDRYEPALLRKTVTDFSRLAEAATPEELAQLVRTMVHRIDWSPSGDGHSIDLYCLPEAQNQPLSKEKDWLERNKDRTWPRGRNVEPVVLVFLFHVEILVEEATLLCPTPTVAVEYPLAKPRRT